MNQIGLQYIYTWKYCKETLCAAILNRQKCHFFFLSFVKSKNEGGTGPAEGGVLIPGRRGRRWGKGARGRIWCKYCVHMNVNGQKRYLLKQFLEWGRGKGEW
jgi:hypothetical protein